ncbi:NFACT family protein [Dialister hominis]|uniref:NFACT family protein n=1 Tax=Dialister hominis TaxID=2582419 RepID=UPI0035206BAA
MAEKSLTVPNLFSDPVSDVDIPLDPQLSINQNSQIYFKKYAKMKTRFKIGMEKVSECEKRLEYLQELKYFLEEAKTKDDILSVQKELKYILGQKESA